MDSSEIKRIAISTGGGDAPGLNAVIRAAVLAAVEKGWDCVGIHDGFNGLLFPEQYPDNGMVKLNAQSVRGITHLGGTILGTTNRGNPMRFPTVQPDGSVIEVDRTGELVELFRTQSIDALITIGGDGSMMIAKSMWEKGMRLVGVPKTIDNDLDSTEVTFGFDTAVSFATECLDRLHTTAESHNRVMVVEVMGRYAGWIALHSGIAGSADAILIPEIPYDLHSVADKINERAKKGRKFSMVVVAEGAKPKDGEVSVIGKEAGRAERLGGVGEKVARQLEAMTHKETRLVVLGHLLRGGSPTSADRLLGLRFGAAAVRGLAEGKNGVMVALNPPHVNYVPLVFACERMKTVPEDSDIIQTGRALGICFGD